MHCHSHEKREERDNDSQERTAATGLIPSQVGRINISLAEPTFYNQLHLATRLPPQPNFYNSIPPCASKSDHIILPACFPFSLHQALEDIFSCSRIFVALRDP